MHRPAVFRKTMRDRHRRQVLGIAVCVVSVVLAACGSADASSAGPAGSAPTALPITGDLDTRCSDPTGDAPGIDVVNVALVSDDEMLVVAYSFSAPVSTLGALILTIEAHSQDGSAQLQLGVQVFNGRPAASFIATSPTAEPAAQYDKVHVVDRDVHAAFPAEAIAALGPRWFWFAMVGGAPIRSTTTARVARALPWTTWCRSASVDRPAA